MVDEVNASGAINASRPVFQDVQALTGAKISQDKASLPKLEAQAKSAPNGKLAANTSIGSSSMATCSTRLTNLLYVQKD